MRKCSSSKVRCSRSTKPLLCGRLPGPAVLDALELQEQFERMLIGPAAVFPAVVREQSFDAQTLLFEVR